jgi:hypothetical protein
VHSYGYFIHVGYMAWREHLELIARYSELDPDVEDDEDPGREGTFGLTMFLLGHNARLTAMYSYLWHMPSLGQDVTAHRVLVQAQGWF